MYLILDLETIGEFNKLKYNYAKSHYKRPKTDSYGLRIIKINYMICDKEMKIERASYNSVKLSYENDYEFITKHNYNNKSGDCFKTICNELLKAVENCSYIYGYDLENNIQFLKDEMIAHYDQDTYEKIYEQIDSKYKLCFMKYTKTLVNKVTNNVKNNIIIDPTLTDIYQYLFNKKYTNGDKLEQIYLIIKKLIDNNDFILCL